jgi:AraC-like DNA-binding protein
MKRKSLQMFNDSDINIQKILKLDLITMNDLEKLSEQEKESLSEILSEKINSLKGIERDKFLEKIDAITDSETRNQLWESNHISITWAISNLTQENGRMPTQIEIANKSGLSRQTIQKHFKEFSSNPYFIDYFNQMKFMSHKVIGKLLKCALQGDIKASRLFLEVTGQLNKDQGKATYIENQNNYLQINNTRLTEEAIKNLPHEKLLQIEELINSKEINSKVP